MLKTRAKILAVLLPLICLGLSSYHVFFPQPQIEVYTSPPMKILYTHYVGSYWGNKMAHTLQEFVHQNHLPCHRHLAEFLSQSDFMMNSDLEANLGCLTDDPPNPLPPGVLYKEVPAGLYARTLRPIESRITTMRVAYQMHDFIHSLGATENGPIMEIFDQGENRMDLTVEMMLPMKR